MHNLFYLGGIHIKVYNYNEPNKHTHQTATLKNYREENINDIIKYLEHKVNKKLTLKQISDDTGISISQMKKLFKEKFGCGVIDFFINLKIEEAKKLIENTSLNFTQISEALGFNSIHYFSKLFKKRTNYTPSQYSKSFNK